MALSSLQAPYSTRDSSPFQAKKLQPEKVSKKQEALSPRLRSRQTEARVLQHQAAWGMVGSDPPARETLSQIRPTCTREKGTLQGLGAPCVGLTAPSMPSLLRPSAGALT